MDIKVTGGDAFQLDTPLLAVGIWEGEALPEAIAGLIEESDWSGKYRQLLVIYPRGAVQPRRVLLAGLGKRAQASTDRLRELAASMAQRARELKVERFACVLPEDPQLSATTTAQALAEGATLGLYRFLDYKTDLKDDDRREIAELTIVASGDDASSGAARGAAIARGTITARNLANRPGNDLPPAKLAEAAQEIGERGGIKVTVLGLAELHEQGFGGIIGVGKGSANEPRFVIMEHGQAQPDKPTICLVGKGITFDTGGISIKPADSMELMKMDMGGAAAVLGAMQAAAELQIPLHIVGLVASAENMPSSTAYKPGDVLKTLSGKTIEVINTDAEGRIVLADALYYAQRYQPAAIIDLATLTGAIMVALGPHAIGMMSNNDDLSDRLRQAGDTSGERVWRMPLWDPYKEMVKSDIADVRNSTGRLGGAITAAAFLSNFVGEYPWAHLDIAGTAWTDQKPRAYNPKGATGIGVRLLIQALQGWVEGR